MQSGRSFNGFGPNPLSFPDIAAWAALNGIQVRPWEIGALKALDVTWMKISIAKARNQQRNRPR